MRKNFSRDFYEVQRKQWQKSIILLLILILFYFFIIGFVSLILVICFNLFFGETTLPSGKTLIETLVFTSVISIAIASFHLYDARKFGAKFIRRRLGAKKPDPSDRYHKRFTNTVEEMRIAAGLPRVSCYVLPFFAINSMALIEADKTPIVIVTEGLLAEFTRDELQAVIAHELAHIIRGDAFYITLVCSLANFFERLREASEPENYPQGASYQMQQGRGGAPLVYFAFTVSAIIMHMLSTLVSREREILADSAAVELNRNPKALARAIYKAHLKNSFVGDFNLTYSPLFIVPPESKGESDSLFARAFNSHPPLMKRIKLLADMGGLSPSGIIEDVWEIQEKREKARSIFLSHEELTQGQTTKVLSPEEDSIQERKIWSVRDPKGKWQGPFTLQELLFVQFFTPMICIKNEQEGIEAPAREFPQVRTARQNLLKKKPINPAKQNRCPHCRISLRESFYEGVPIKICPQCEGKLIDSALMDRLIARREVGFSDFLIKKAEEFRENFLSNPFNTKKINQKKSPNIFCPNCGARMISRPYNYQYVIPVDKCLSCHKIWFDSDELEILQILIEKR